MCILQILKILSKYFYFSTMEPQPNLAMESQSFSPIYIPVSQSMLSQISMDSYMFSIMNYQNCLNLELLKNQNLISDYLSQRKQQTHSCNSSKQGSSTSEGMENSSLNRLQIQTNLEKKTIDEPNPNFIVQSKESSVHVEQKKAKKIKIYTEDSEYEPEISDRENVKLSKSSQSKNVPKNFSKAILLFIKRKQNLVCKIVEHERGNYKQFMEMTQKLKGKINSISELRSLWIQQENKFAKILRIISDIYIKRNSLQHIFNSRIQDYSKHLKYRSKISQVLKNPIQFTRMKDY